MKGLRNQGNLESETTTDPGQKQKLIQNNANISQSCFKIEPWKFQNSKFLHEVFSSGHNKLEGFNRARLTSVQENLDRNFAISKTFETALVSLTKIRLTSGQENQGGSRSRLDPRRTLWGFILCKKSSGIHKQTYPKIHSKIDREKTWNMIPKECQDGTKVDPTNHQKTMPKQVSKQI